MPIPPSSTPSSKRTTAKLSASYMGSSDELVAKLRGGSASNYDVISPSSDVAASIVHAGLAAPLDLSKIAVLHRSFPQNFAIRLWSKLKRPGLRRSLHVGTESASLRHDCVFAAARFLDDFLGSEIQGKISLWDELSSIYMAAQILGYDKPDPNQLYNLTDDQLEAVKKKLIELKPNVRKYLVHRRRAYQSFPESRSRRWPWAGR